VNRAGHCEFTPAETIAAFNTLALRLTTGRWKNFTPADLNNEASALGSTYNVLDVDNQIVVVAPAYETYKPANFLRIYDAFTN
jgi:hypothetical protein